MNFSKKQIIFAISLSVLLITIAFYFGNPYPSDRNLEKRFSKNKADFEHLVRLFQEDLSLEKVDDDGKAWVDYDTKITIAQEKKELYQQLLEKLKLQEIRRFKQNSDIYFLAYRTSNLIIGSKSKYYVFTKTKPENTVESLDIIASSSKDANVYKRLEDNWYLYLDIW